MNQQRRITLAVACACASMMAGQASALEIYKDKGWTLDISGSVNAFYTAVKADGADRASNVENGLLPGFLKVTATTQQNGYDIKGVVGYWPGINSDTEATAAPGTGTVSGTGSATAGVGKSHGDARTTFMTFGNANMGSFKFGRDVGLFQSNAILNDMTLIGVGGGGGLARSINTTLGGIGAGYIYTEFQSQITYTTPKMGGLTMNIGMFDNKDIDSTGAAGKQNGYQGLAEFALSNGKLWAGFVQQKFTKTRQATANGYEFGGKLDIGNLGLMAQGFNGKGIGGGVLFSGAFNGNEARKSNGHLVQVTYKIGDLKIGANTGLSNVKATDALDTGASKTQGTTVGLYYGLSPAVTLVAEQNQRKNKLATSNPNTNTTSLGAILFF